MYQPDATAYPIAKYPENERQLKDFKWLMDERPKEEEFIKIIEFVKGISY